MQPILQIKNLHKSFKNLNAVNGVSFDVAEGICLGLLGPNGAGKTTTIEILEGILQADSGDILYRGKPLGDEFQSRAGIMFQSTALQDYISVKESLELFQGLYATHYNLNKLITDCSLLDFLHQDTAKLSGGQRQRLLLAIALVNDPDIIFLDEPTTGLDPQARHSFWQLIHHIKKQNKSIILTTHYMDEAYELCDDIIIMDHGKIIAQGTPKNLLSQYFSDVVIKIPYSANIENLLNSASYSTDFNINPTHNTLEIRTSDINKIIQQLISSNISLDGLQIRERTLDDLFLELTGSGIRQ